MAVIPSLQQQMSDLDHRIHRHETFLHNTQSQFNRDKRRLLGKLDKFISVFADLQRRPDERLSKIPMVEKFREEEEVVERNKNCLLPSPAVL